MAARAELFTTKVVLENRAYFFNVKENRTGDVFLQVVESKGRDDGEFERRTVVVFAEDMREFLKGLDDSLSFIDKDRKSKSKAAYEKQLKKNTAKAAGSEGGAGKSAKSAPAVKRTGVVRVASKRKAD
ncbi:MAG: DUF3276 family protein [Treponema sp.]|jgi:hypothetical protein|nr:DUF3276 family protein [Treponema sp.]